MAKRRTYKKKQNSTFKIVLGVIICAILLISGRYIYKKARFYYAVYQSEQKAGNLTNTAYEKMRISNILSEHQNSTFGIDISHYQDNMRFDSLHLLGGLLPIEFIVMRSTMGDDGVDKRFKKYWNHLENTNYIRGAYHYYRPWESPKSQAKLYINKTDLKKGDLRPILDIEKISNNQNSEHIRNDIQIWLDMVENKYGEKPIIYTYYHFYIKHLKGYFKGYPLWLANYNNVKVPISEEKWDFWQFSENGIIPSVPHKLDLNVFNGSRTELEKFTLQ